MATTGAKGGTSAARTGVLQTLTTPLKFFGLIILAIEGMLAALVVCGAQINHYRA